VVWEVVWSVGAVEAAPADAVLDNSKPAGQVEILMLLWE
jgi:hypothetical protein